jgi:hypothetical protein
MEILILIYLATALGRFSFSRLVKILREARGDEEILIDMRPFWYAVQRGMLGSSEKSKGKHENESFEYDDNPFFDDDELKYSIGADGELVKVEEKTSCYKWTFKVRSAATFTQ